MDYISINVIPMDTSEEGFKQAEREINSALIASDLEYFEIRSSRVKREAGFYAHCERPTDEEVQK
jgi:hypothetical protein